MRHGLLNPCCLLWERPGPGSAAEHPNSSRQHCEPVTLPSRGGAWGSPWAGPQGAPGNHARGVATGQRRVRPASSEPPPQPLLPGGVSEFPASRPRREVRCPGSPSRAGPRGRRGRAPGREPGPGGEEPQRRRPKAAGSGAEAAAGRGRGGGRPAHGAPRPRGQRAPCGPAELTALGAAPPTRAPSHAGHEGVAGPAKHLPGHDRHPLRRHA